MHTGSPALPSFALTLFIEPFRERSFRSCQTEPVLELAMEPRYSLQLSCRGLSHQPSIETAFALAVGTNEFSCTRLLHHERIENLAHQNGGLTCPCAQPRRVYNMYTTPALVGCTTCTSQLRRMYTPVATRP